MIVHRPFPPFACVNVSIPLSGQAQDSVGMCHQRVPPDTWPSRVSLLGYSGLDTLTHPEGADRHKSCWNRKKNGVDAEKKSRLAIGHAFVKLPRKDND